MHQAALLACHAVLAAFPPWIKQPASCATQGRCPTRALQPASPVGQEPLQPQGKRVARCVLRERTQAQGMTALQCAFRVMMERRHTLELSLRTIAFRAILGRTGMRERCRACAVRSEQRSPRKVRQSARRAWQGSIKTVRVRHRAPSAPWARTMSTHEGQTLHRVRPVHLIKRLRWDRRRPMIACL